MLYGYRHCIIVYKKTEDIFKDIAEDVETRFDTSNYDLNRLLLKVKNKKITCGMNVELGGKIMKEFVELRAKACSYLIDDGCEDKRIFKKNRSVENLNLKIIKTV